MARRLFAAMIVAGSLVVLAGPAGAKGIGQATLTGPGLPADGIAIPAPSRPMESVIGSIMGAWIGPSSTHDGVRTRDLGPRYRLTVSLEGFPGGTSSLMTFVYPYARSGSAWTYTPAGQRPNPEGPELASGWRPTNPGFTHFLVLHGLPARAPAGYEQTARTEKGSSVALAAAVGIGGAVALWTALSLARRRRSSR